MLHTSANHSVAPRPTTRVTEVTIGALFLLATATFAGGGVLLARYFEAGAAENERLLMIGVLLQMTCGLAVAAIGVLFYRVLAPFTPVRAAGYLGARGGECVVILACGLWLLATETQVPEYDLLIYAFTGLGGLLLASALLTTRLVPRWLAMLGLGGYAVFMASLPLDLFGLGELDSTLGVALILGGLFEIALPFVLILRGFSPNPSIPKSEARHARTPANG